MLISKIRQFLSSQKTIEEKLFWGILLFSIMAAFISTAFTLLFEGFGGYAGILSYVAVFMLVVVLSRKRRAAYLHAILPRALS